MNVVQKNDESKKKTINAHNAKSRGKKKEFLSLSEPFFVCMRNYDNANICSTLNFSSVLCFMGTL